MSSPDFASVHNYYERPVMQAVAELASLYPAL